MYETTTEQSMLSYPPISMDIKFGEAARKKELMYDVDVEAVRDSLLMGGIHESDIATTNVIFEVGTEPAFKGYFTEEHPLNDANPAMTFYSYEGDENVSAKVAAHEAKHFADHLYEGDAAFTPQMTRRNRKIAAVVLATSAGFAPNIGYELIDPQYNPMTLAIYAASSLISTNAYMNTTLMVEYALRKEERVARRAEKHIDTTSLLTILHDGEPYKKKKRPNIRKIGRLVKSAVIPSFDL